MEDPVSIGQIIYIGILGYFTFDIGMGNLNVADGGKPYGPVSAISYYNLKRLERKRYEELKRKNIELTRLKAYGLSKKYLTP